MSLSHALDASRRVFGGQDGLLPTLAADAVLARAADDLIPCVPRLLELTVTGQLGDVASWTLPDLLVAHNWTAWPREQCGSIENVLDTWWATVLSMYPAVPAADEVLGSLVHLQLPMVRWLQPMLEALDGPAACHLADLIQESDPSPAWNGYDDERRQLLAWCRTEPVVMGLTVVGGVYLADGQLGELLDVLLV